MLLRQRRAQANETNEMAKKPNILHVALPQPLMQASATNNTHFAHTDHTLLRTSSYTGPYPEGRTHTEDVRGQEAWKNILN